MSTEQATVSEEVAKIMAALVKMREDARRFRDESEKHSPEASHEWACRFSAYSNALRAVREIAG
jgi:hypothetical protein